MKDIEQTVWEQHDRRLNDHEVRFNQGTQQFTEIKEALKQLTERINEGVSKTQQKLLEENKQIEIAIRDLGHSVELNTEKMNNKIDIVNDAMIKRIVPLEESTRQRDRIYVWGILSAVIMGIVMWGTKVALEKLQSNLMTNDQSYMDHVRSLTPKSTKGSQ